MDLRYQTSGHTRTAKEVAPWRGWQQQPRVRTNVGNTGVAWEMYNTHAVGLKVWDNAKNKRCMRIWGCIQKHWKIKDKQRTIQTKDGYDKSRKWPNLNKLTWGGIGEMGNRQTEDGYYTRKSSSGMRSTCLGVG